MAHYRKIDARIWNDAKFMALSERGKLMFLFILTHPAMTMLGAMRGSLAGMIEELVASNDTSGFLPQMAEGYLEGLREGYREGCRQAIEKGMLKHDEKALLIWLPNFLKYNKPESPNVIRAWPTAFDLIPESSLKDLILQSLITYHHSLSEGFRKAFIEAFPIARRHAMPNQEQEQEQELLQYSSSKSTGPQQPILAELVMSNGRIYSITESAARKFSVLYPKVDVVQCLRNMAGWLQANPKRRKTRIGMPRFINTWLKQENEKASEPQRVNGAHRNRPNGTEGIVQENKSRQPGDLSDAEITNLARMSDADVKRHIGVNATLWGQVRDRRFELTKGKN